MCQCAAGSRDPDIAAVKLLCPAPGEPATRRRHSSAAGVTSPSVISMTESQHSVDSQPLVEILRTDSDVQIIADPALLEDLVAKLLDKNPELPMETASILAGVISVGVKASGLQTLDGLQKTTRPTRS